MIGQKKHPLFALKSSASDVVRCPRRVLCVNMFCSGLGRHDFPLRSPLLRVVDDGPDSHASSTRGPFFVTL